MKSPCFKVWLGGLELGNGSSFFVTKWHLHNPSRHRKEESKTKTEIQFRTTFSLMEKLEISLSKPIFFVTR